MLGVVVLPSPNKVGAALAVLGVKLNPVVLLAGAVAATVLVVAVTPNCKPAVDAGVPKVSPLESAAEETGVTMFSPVVAGADDAGVPNVSALVGIAEEAGVPKVWAVVGADAAGVPNIRPVLGAEDAEGVPKVKPEKHSINGRIFHKHFGTTTNIVIEPQNKYYVPVLGVEAAGAPAKLNPVNVDGTAAGAPKVSAAPVVDGAVAPRLNPPPDAEEA